MCIIVSKEQGVSFPSKSTLRTCFYNNPDGAGFMYVRNERVVIRKGYMTFQAFWRSLKKARAKTGDMAPYVMHFRISTQAGVNKQCCHPYPVSRRMTDLKELATDTDIGIAHNGIIDLTTEYTYTWSKNKAAVTYNDTMKFITDYASFIIKDENWNTADNIQLIKNLIDDTRNRLAVLDWTGHIEYIGKSWNCDENGVMYSNTSWEKPKAKTVTPTTYTAATVTYQPQTYKSTWNYPSYSAASGYTNGYRYGDYNEEEDFYNWAEAHYDPQMGWYDFDPEDCPSSKYQDDTWCCDCVHYKDCMEKLYQAEKDWRKY